MKALIIDEPWISAILNGSKTWEMRKTNCKIRGQIALIRKGSGQVVGTANLIDSGPPIATRADYAAAEQHHRIPAARQERAFKDGWRTPWVLANARPLQMPVPYKHPSGAVIWVNLEPDVVTKLRAQANMLFVEIPAIRSDSPQSCSECETGRLVERRGAAGNLFGCTNYPYCKHTQKVAQNCR